MEDINMDKVDKRNKGAADHAQDIAVIAGSSLATGAVVEGALIAAGVAAATPIGLGVMAVVGVGSLIAKAFED